MVSNTRRTTDTRRIRRLKPSLDLEVEADVDGTPLRLRLHERWLAVSLVRRPWRIDQHWWRGVDSISRMYYRVAPEDGPSLTVYRDLKAGTWWRQEY